MRISRRLLLTSIGGIAAGTAAWRGLGQSIEDTGRLLEEWSNHEEQWHTSICRQCPGGCGILARVVDGRLVRIAGNPLHPVNRGGLCMKGLAGAQMLYDPDRIRSPLKRAGRRGQGKWKPIGWEEAIAEVGTRLKRLRDEGQPHTTALLGGQYRGLTDQLLQRFAAAYGTPNYLRYRCMTPEKGAPTYRFMHGLNTPLCHDLANSRYVLSFGCNLLESWQSTVHQIRSYGLFRERQSGERAQLVQVDTRYSVTAAKADRWIPVKPGTDGALALGLAYIIIQEGLYDREFVQNRTFGFEDWEDDAGAPHMGFKTLVLEDYAPERVAEVTGVPVETLFQVARGFAGAKPAIAIGERGPSFHAGDIYTRMAIHSLNALVGSFGVSGGIFRQGQVPLTPWEDAQSDATARKGLAMPRIDGITGTTPFVEHDVQNLPRNIAAGRPYALNALLLYYTNPLFSHPDRAGWLAALEKIPFVVSFSPFMDETTQHADLVLPDHTYLERWQDDEITFLPGFTLFSIGRPVVPPVQNTRQSEDVLLAVAHRLDEPVAAALPWETWEEVLFERAEGLFEAGRGHIAMPPREAGFESILAEQGFWQSAFESYDDFWEELLRKGAWVDGNDSYVGPRQLFNTPSHRFEFYSQILKREMARGGRGFPRRLGIVARGDRLYLPHFEQPDSPTSERDYPFVLNAYKLMSQPAGRGANQPWLQQQPAAHVDGGWDSWVEINPEVAETHGIRDGDAVWLESPKGRIRARAVRYAGAMPGVLNMPLGQGHRAYGRWAKNRGQNPNDIIENHDDPLRGLPVLGGTRVRLWKA